MDVAWLSRNEYFLGFKRGGIEWKIPAGKVTSHVEIDAYAAKRDLVGNYVILSPLRPGPFREDAADSHYRVELTTTPCNLGGIRFWFLCPLVENSVPCGKRVRKLYLPPGESYFACRSCYNLTYRSVKEHDKRVDALRRLPPGQLLRALHSDDPRRSFLALKASLKKLGS